MVAPVRKRRFAWKQKFVPKKYKTWKIPFKFFRQIGGHKVKRKNVIKQKLNIKN